ncbi:MAG: DivIVA domain-containing protein [Nitrospira sp.]|nr:DivIVA domain-containing protein [Nitrospira sp.]
MSDRLFQPSLPLLLPSHQSHRSIAMFLALTVFMVASSAALAEIRVVNAQGEHRMGNRDTREDAIRLAGEAAKRNALEQVATYLESVTVVHDMDVTKDEIRSYTAGLVLVLHQQIATTLDGDVVVVKVDLLAQMDTDEVARAIAALRENEDARVQLAALKQENEQLQEELKAVNHALGNAATAEQIQQAAQKRKDILNRVQSNAMVSQAWTNWVLVSPIGIPQGLLNNASSLYPTNPHIAIAQQTIANRQPQGPRQPPSPGSLASPRMPRHELIPPPGVSGVPRTPNEIVHRVPPGRLQSDHQPMIQLRQGPVEQQPRHYQFDQSLGAPGTSHKSGGERP